MGLGLILSGIVLALATIVLRFQCRRVRELAAEDEGTLPTSA